MKVVLATAGLAAIALSFKLDALLTIILSFLTWEIIYLILERIV